MKYVVYSEDWSKPVYFCPHAGNGFTVSTDVQKAEAYASRREALVALAHFGRQSNMKCELRRI